MRTKNKITREQHRVKKAQKQESKVLYFAQDPQECNAFKEIFKTEYNNLIKK